MERAYFHQDPILLTPGPLSTTMRTKQAMLKDWGTWDESFHEMTQTLCAKLLKIIDGEEDFTCIPMQGSGTYAVEASVSTLIPRKDSCTLVLINGLYGQRSRTILEYMGKKHLVLDKGDYLPPMPDEVEALFKKHPDITHVLCVHCETCSGIINPVKEIGALCKTYGKILILDAMSSFGAIPLTIHDVHYDALISSANKCIEGVPGFAFVLVRTELLKKSKGHSMSFCLDLYDQWEGFSKPIMWRFTPPAHVIAAFLEALLQHEEEGGCAGRLERYQANQRTLISGMRSLGLITLLEEPWLSPILTTFLAPADNRFTFKQFYTELKSQGFIIYPGKLISQDSFRIGTIGQLTPEIMHRFVDAVGMALSRMGITPIM